MGFSSSLRLSPPRLLLVLTFVVLALPTVHADQLKKKDGTLINGQILGVSGQGADKQVMVTAPGGQGKIPYYLSDIDSVTMDAPAAITQAKGAAPAAAVAVLEPQIAQFAGLPADWVPAAMAELAEAYAALNQAPKAVAIYNQIDLLYPGSKYHLQAVAGKAQLSLQQGDVTGALAAVQPVIDAANQNLSPSQADGGLYANAFLVYGQAMEAQKKPQQALEAYLTVKTMFYQNPDLAQRADQLASKLREQNPGLGVE